MDRFDFSQDFRDIVTEACRLNIVDAITLLACGHNGASEAEVLDLIMECKYASRHCVSPETREQYSALQDQIDAYYAARRAEVANA